MKTYEFDIVIAEIEKITDGLADAIFAAGCDDGTPASRNGIARIHFDRDATSLEAAIMSAVAQLQSVGVKVAKVELDEKAAISLGV